MAERAADLFAADAEQERRGDAGGEALYLKEPFDVARFEPQVEREVLAEFLLFGLGVVEAVQSLLSVPVFEAEREPVVGIVTVECGQGVAVSGGRIAPALAGRGCMPQ